MISVRNNDILLQKLSKQKGSYFQVERSSLKVD